MRITDINVTDSGACKIEIDGENAALLDYTQLKERSLAVGKELSRAEYEELCALGDLCAAKNSAFRSLAKSDFSQRGLVKRLTEKGVARENAEAAVLELAEKGYLSDDAFADKLMRYYRDEKCYGPRRVRDELYRRGVPRELIEEKIAESDFDIEGYCEKKFSRILPDEKTKRRVLSALARAGYDYEDSRYAIARLFCDDEDELD